MNDFWSKRLGSNNSAVQPAATPAQTYHPPTITAPYTTAQQGNPKAPSSKSVKHCPECGSGHYTGSPADSTRMTRCYDCGYNPRFGSQSGSAGMPSSQSKAATPARQVSKSNNYQPGTIVGRIGE